MNKCWLERHNPPDCSWLKSFISLLLTSQIVSTPKYALKYSPTSSECEELVKESKCFILVIQKLTFNK